MIYILDVSSDTLIQAEIVLAGKVKMPLKKEGWNFNWKDLLKERNTKTYILRTLKTPDFIEGVLQLRTERGMLIMDAIEIAPHNIGSHQKKYDYVAGCLISFACRESFKIEGDYKGYLTFVSKTNLIEWYSVTYRAEQALGQRMFIRPEIGAELMDTYLHRTN